MWLIFLCMSVQVFSTSLCSHLRDQDLTTTASESQAPGSANNSCPPWFDHGSGGCYCRQASHHHTVLCDEKERSIKVQTGQCVTRDDHINKTLLTECPYFSKKSPSNESICEHFRYTVPSTVSKSDLNSFVCARFHRKGVHCGRCLEGYGPAPFLSGPNIPCVKCSKHNYVWLAYLAMQLLFVSLMYCASVFCEIRGMASPLNVLAYFHQVVINAITSNGWQYAQLACRMDTLGPLSVMITLYSFWNLDFFRFLLPPVCVSPSLSNADVLLFDYIVALFPILLTALCYFLIQLHDKGVCLIVTLWKPFRLLASRYKKDWNPRRSTLNTFITFLLLSYSKLLFTSANLMYGVPVFDNSDRKAPDSPVLYYDTSMTYLGRKHTAYIAFALLIVVVFVILPPVLLLLYLTRCFKSCLERCGFRRWNALNIIVDVFQGWYRDGTNGTSDYRALSALYMLLRLGFASEFVLVFMFQYRTQLNSFEWTLPSLVHIALGCFYLAARPYKRNWMNVVDGLVLVLLGIIVMMAGLGDNDYTLLVAFSASFLPTLVMLGYLLRRLLKALKLAHRFRKLWKIFRDCIQRFSARSEEVLDDESFVDRRLVESHDPDDFEPRPSLLSSKREVHPHGCGSEDVVPPENSMLVEYGTF